MARRDDPAIAAALLLALALCAPGEARAQSADLVLCDRVAAHPADPDKPADVKGVAEIAASDIATAIKFCKTASGSSRRALYQLGRAHAANGQSAEAAATFRRAADKGSSAAMVDLGMLHMTGNGVPKDAAQARSLFERAAAAGNPRGMMNLAAISGGGAPPSRAVLTQAAEANSPEAQFQLGVMYAEGTNGPRDDVAARTLFERAAAQNHASALEWAGAFAEQGRGGPKDESLAKSYFERAAALGNENAKAALARMNCSFRIKDKSGKPVMCF